MQVILVPDVRARREKSRHPAPSTARRERSAGQSRCEPCPQLLVVYLVSRLYLTSVIVRDWRWEPAAIW